MELIEQKTNIGDYSVSFLPQARTRGIEHVSMRRLASTQSKHDGTNQSSFCSVENSMRSRATAILSSGRKSGHDPWQTYHAKDMNER